MITPTPPPAWEDACRVPGGFYLSPQWLRSADGDHISQPAYIIEGDVYLAAHYSPQENNAFYPKGLILGGRRGYLSPVLGGGDVAPAIAAACAHHGVDTWAWPYLPTAAAARVARDTGQVPLLAGAHCVLDVSPVEDHIDAMSSRQRRTNARRELRRFHEAGLTVTRHRLGEGPATPEALGPLLGQVQRAYGHDHSDEILTDLLCRQRDELADSSVVFLARDTAVAGFSLCYRFGEDLYVRLVGFDRQRGHVGAYGVLAIFEPLAYAADNGLRRIFLGMESFEAKVRRGARVEPLWTLANYPLVPASVERIAAQLPPTEADAFRQSCTIKSDTRVLWRTCDHDRPL
ncbi:GNAT family N-acetyltransferase [Corynebacterium sp. 13CS0277]|uniref:GNAT family N-acetyltransferase n=1 Tax=Corynebacterium sp. 13CS0277 TaxID=2071994 RepID=UPI000D038A35|nr:GNAT family N-acetyltransferase [Corynebacterium sp. 13CS0277]PRQ11816.1 GNAT family N-acetyltransferase [Corynebacterium sp. 13CS0277]